MRWQFATFLIFTFLSKCFSENYECTTVSLEATCTGINAQDLSEDMSANLNKTDITTLNITSSSVETISATTFKDFANLQSLYITDSGVINVENNAFSFSKDLQDLSLKHNALKDFNVRSFPVENNLKSLDLSDNLLNDFSGFNVSHFPKLRVLNLTNNLLSHVPTSLVKMLEEKNEFYLIVDDNPWDCTDPEWSGVLTDKLIKAFCAQIHEKRSSHADELSNVIEEIKTETATTKANINSMTEDTFQCAKCSFYYCILWMVAGVWIGIILGNVGKVKKLLCKKSATHSDGGTQCGKKYSMVPIKSAAPTGSTHLRRDKE